MLVQSRTLILSTCLMIRCLAHTKWLRFAVIRPRL